MEGNDIIDDMVKAIRDEEDFTEEDYCACDPNERIEKSTDDMQTWVCVDCGGIIV